MRVVAAPLVAVLLAVAGATSCRATDAATAPPIVQPGAPGQPSRVITADEAADVAGTRHTAADVAFMQGMIGHHAQALDMTALVPDRSHRRDMQLLAQRIDLSQADEIKMMGRWLEVRGEDVPSTHALHEPGATLMPGMLNAEEMSRLRESTGAAFDQLFLEFMIKHHAGALIMVDELFATPSAGQEMGIFAFASEVVADQPAEMDRMSAMLNAMQRERQP